MQDNVVERVARELGLPPDVSVERVLEHIRYLNRLIYKLSRPGLKAQVPHLYELDTAHVQEMR